MTISVMMAWVFPVIKFCEPSDMHYLLRSVQSAAERQEVERPTRKKPHNISNDPQVAFRVKYLVEP